MVSHHVLEKTIYDLFCDRPCTRIHGRPTYQHFCTLSRECQEVAFEINVGYAWCADLGLSPLIVGAAAHHRDTGKIFTEPVQPPNVNARIVTGTTVAERAQYAAEHDELKEWFAMVKGFRGGSTENIRDALDEAYYRQLKHVCLGYRRVNPRSYFANLEFHWCKLDTATIKKIKAAFRTPWGEDEHVTEFKARLERDQAELDDIGITTSNVDKF